MVRTPYVSYVCLSQPCFTSSQEDFLHLPKNTVSPPQMLTSGIITYVYLVHTVREEIYLQLSFVQYS